MKYILFIFSLLFTVTSFAQDGNRSSTYYFAGYLNIGANSTAPPPGNAYTNIGTGSDTGGLIIPRWANTSSNTAPQLGEIFYNKSTNRVGYYTGAAFRELVPSTAEDFIKTGGNTPSSELTLGTTNSNTIGFLVNGTKVSGFTASGILTGPGMRNATTANNSLISTTDSGTYVSRNANNAFAALTVNKVIGTASVVQMQFGGRTGWRHSVSGHTFNLGSLVLGDTTVVSLLPGLTLFSSQKQINIFNTADAAANYEGSFLGYAGNALKILTNKGGTGTLRPITLGCGSDQLTLQTSGDAELLTTSAGIILKSPNGTRYKITVDNAGVISAAVAP